MNENDATPLVSIITVNYNGYHYLDMLLSSLRKISYSAVEIIVVDNASTDDSVEQLRKNFPEVRLLENEENYMFARGNNEGIKIARGEIICLINNDVEVDPHFLEPIVKAFREESDMAVCQPKVLDLNNPDTYEYAGGAGGFIDMFGYPFLRGRLFFTLERDRGQYEKRREIFWASGACFCMRADILPQAGLLDEDFHMHMEEIDLCWRLHLLQKKILFIPESRIWHKGGGTLQQENPRKIYWNFRNNIFLLVKNLGTVNLVKVILARLVLDTVALFAELLKGNFKASGAILSAYRWLVGNISLMKSKRRQIQNIRQTDDKEIYRLVYPGSIVWEYFVMGHKFFSDLKRIRHLSNH